MASKKLFSGISTAEINELLTERRRELAHQAATAYGETGSLRKAAAKLKISHETVRVLLREAAETTQETAE